MTNINTGDKSIKRTARIRTVRLDELRVSSVAQREFKAGWGKEIAENLDFDLIGTFTCSLRDGIYWIIDGQHRFYGLKEYVKRQFGDDWGEWTTEVWVHFDLTEEDEARLFLEFNNRKPVDAFDRFKVGIRAGYHDENDINRVVLALGLTVAKGGKPYSMSAVTALRNVYELGGPALLRQTLATIRDAWDGDGFKPFAINGIAAVTARYEGRLDGDRLTAKLAAEKNGPISIQQRAAGIRESLGASAREANAAAVLDIYNKGLRGRSNLGSWFRVGAAA